MADRLRTNSPDSLFSKMCFAWRKTSLRYGDGEYLRSFAAVLHLGLHCGCPLDQNGRNEHSGLPPVQLGVTMPKKTYQHYIPTVGRSAFSLSWWLI
jgi:hypothetical protein